MAQLLGELTEVGTLNTDIITRHEHHKIIVVVSNYVSDVSFKVEDISFGESNPINLNGANGTKTLDGNEAWSFLIENERFNKLRANFVSGDATLNIYYEGW